MRQVDLNIAEKIGNWRKSHESAIREVKFTLHLLRQNPLTVIGFIMFFGLIIIAILDIVLYCGIVL